jgi:hypothetical protein
LTDFGYAPIGIDHFAQADDSLARLAAAAFDAYLAHGGAPFARGVTKSRVSPGITPLRSQ